MKEAHKNNELIILYLLKTYKTKNKSGCSTLSTLKKNEILVLFIFFLSNSQNILSKMRLFKRYFFIKIKITYLTKK